MVTTVGDIPHGRFSRRAQLELAAALLAGAVKVVLDSLGLLPNWLVVAVLAALWAGYILGRAWRHPQLWAEWGLRRTNFAPAALTCAILLVISLAGIAVLGLLLHGQLRWHWSLPVVAAVYPLWGLAQQFMLHAIVTSNLARVPGLRLRRWAVMLVAAFLFGVSHLPRLELVAGTFVFGLLVVPVYLKWRNLWPIALLHGVVGTFMFYWVLDQQPLSRFLENLGPGWGW